VLASPMEARKRRHETHGITGALPADNGAAGEQTEAMLAALRRNVEELARQPAASQGLPLLMNSIGDSSAMYKQYCHTLLTQLAVSTIAFNALHDEYCKLRIAVGDPVTGPLPSVEAAIQQAMTAANPPAAEPRVQPAKRPCNNGPAKPHACDGQGAGEEQEEKPPFEGLLTGGVDGLLLGNNQSHSSWSNNMSMDAPAMHPPEGGNSAASDTTSTSGAETTAEHEPTAPRNNLGREDSTEDLLSFLLRSPGALASPQLQAALSQDFANYSPMYSPRLPGGGAGLQGILPALAGANHAANTLRRRAPAPVGAAGASVGASSATGWLGRMAV